MQSEKKVRVPCAYTTERVAVIRQAMREWYRALPKPRNLVAAQRLNTSDRTVSIYVSNERPQYGPSPEVMLKLWQETKNPVFLMLRSEKEIFRQRGFKIPDESSSADVSHEIPPVDHGRSFKAPDEVKRDEKLVSSLAIELDKTAIQAVETKSVTAAAPGTFTSMAQKLIMAMSINLSVVGDLLPQVQAGGSLTEIKVKAAELVTKIVQIFDLGPDDFRSKRTAVEPVLGEKMEKVLDTVFRKPK